MIAAGRRNVWWEIRNCPIIYTACTYVGFINKKHNLIARNNVTLVAVDVYSDV
jgi:hypothetical protein